MWQEWEKDGKVYNFEMTLPPHFCDEHKCFRCTDASHGADIPYMRKHHLTKSGFTPVFDLRWVRNLNGRNGSLILENDILPPVTIENLQRELSKHASKLSVHKAFTSLHPGHIAEIKQILDGRLAKNILIDSMFADVEQFRFMVIKLFADYTENNFFMQSHGMLLNRLNDELEHHMDKYPVRNSYYKNFNELTFTLLKNYMYEVSTDASGAPEFATRIKYNNSTNRCEYGTKYVFKFGEYKTDWSDTHPEEKKSKWSI